MMRLLVVLVMLCSTHFITSAASQSNPTFTYFQRTYTSMPRENPYELAMRKVPRKQDVYVQLIVDKYRVDEELAREIVELAHKHQRDAFPRARDIIAVVGIESSFNPQAKSSLPTDPALGLMQIRAGVWKIPSEDLLSVEENIKHGALILEHYYEELGRRDCAIQAYNRGITAYKQGEKNPRYLQKFQQEVALYR